MVMERKVFSNRLLPFALTLPQLVVTLVFFVWPSVQAVWQSLLLDDAFGGSAKFLCTDLFSDPLAGESWGRCVRHYANLFHDPYYWRSVRLTLLFSAIVTVAGLVLSLIFAVLVDRSGASKTYTTLLVWPYAVAPAIAAVLWGFLFNPKVGVVTYLLKQWFDYDFNYLVNGGQALGLCIAIACWTQFSYNFLFFLAALKSIPQSLLEASALDGASAFGTFRTITLPLLSPTAFFLMVVNVIFSFFGTFGVVNALTRGGPASQTNILGVVVIAFPVWIAFVAATHDAPTMYRAPIPLLPGGQFFHNIETVLSRGVGLATKTPLWRILANTAVMALGIALGKMVISFTCAYAIVYFRFPFRRTIFWLVFATLMLPVEVRIVPTYAVVADLGMLNSFWGLIVPLTASATATFLFRQFFLSIPNELVEAARVDGAGPLDFMKDILLPMSRTTAGALFVVLFIYGWNQYLWPLLVTTDDSYTTVVQALARQVDSNDEPLWNLVMTGALLAMLPTVAVVVGMQRLFVKGIIESDK
jgi:sn-glycerol 3-phosphate transport system permease protein